MNGACGETGARGAEGAPGKLPKVKRWTQDDVTYEGEIVVHGNNTYQALKDTGSVPGATFDWICVAAAGRDAVSPTVRDTYDAKENYRALDIVVSDGAAFIARRDNPGALPGDGWKMIARQGGRGIAGPKGERGPPGPAGSDGKPGAPAPTLRSWKLDRVHYTATPVMSDGTHGPALELRSLFQQFNEETN